MSIEKMKYDENGHCNICKQHKPTLVINVIVACGYENYDTDIEICKDCFNINYKNRWNEWLLESLRKELNMFIYELESSCQNHDICDTEYFYEYLCH